MVSSQLHSQEFDPYKLEKEGRIIHPVNSSEGILFTDNFYSAIYLFKNGETRQIFASPNCGRDFQLSPDKSKVAFKFIDSLGRQAPAIFDLRNQALQLLHKSENLCGQPVFWGKSGIAYTIGHSVFIISDENEIEVNISNYCNQIAVSPDASCFIWNDKNQQLYLHDLEKGVDKQISNPGISCINPKFSPDGSKIVFSSIGGQLFVFSLSDNEIFEIGSGGNPCWLNSSEEIIFEQSTIKDFKFINSDLFIVDYRGRNKRQLTADQKINKSQPFYDNGELLFASVENRKIFSAKIDFEKAELKDLQILFEHNQLLPMRYYPVHKFIRQKNLVDLGEMPYIHQVYDTPDFHDGSGSCGPTTAVMALASFNILPPWPTTINKLFIHENDFGSYVADKYHFNGTFFDSYTNPYSSNSWGAYSYMWATGSPSSTMRNYYSIHGLDASQSWTYNCSFDDTKNEIDDGFPHTICNYMTVAGHIILAKGYIENQFTLLFHDPFGNKNTSGYPSYDGANVFYDWPGYNNGYQNLDADGTHGGIAWSVTTRKNIPVYNDTIVDDLAFGHGFYIFNEPPSHMQYFRDQTSGYNNHSWWTITIDSNIDVCNVTWQANILEDGLYEISAYIPAGFSNAQQSKYYISTNQNTSEVIIDQSQYSNEWALLGYLDLTVSRLNTVYLGDNTGIAGQQMVFDAMRFSRAALIDIHEISNSKEKMFIFPNPVVDEFTIILPKSEIMARINIIDMKGRLVYSDDIFPSQHNLKINVQKLNFVSGIYFVLYNNGVNNYSIKISIP